VKLRRYHRWLVVPFGLILLWVAMTGVAMQAVDIYDHGGLSQPERPQQASIRAAAAPFATTPAPAIPGPAGQPPRSKARQLHGLLQHLHSGEWFGPFGTIIQTLAGLSLNFFAVSGMWMYLTMYRRREHRHYDGQKLFW
jgi:uncharacterized iron-regulated membrane protein